MQADPAAVFPPQTPSREPIRFLDLIDGGRLRECFSKGNGNGVKVGLLDSGVASHHPDLDGKVVANYEVIGSGNDARVVESAQGEDVLDHGTANAFLIHQQAPEAEIHSVQVLGPQHNTSSERLLAALDFAIDQEWDVINLSLGTELNFDKFADIADRAYYSGVILVAAKANRPDAIGFPAGLSSVVGVDLEHFESPEQFRFSPLHCIEVEASGIYLEAPSIHGGNRNFTGTSFACPQVTGMAARLRSVFPEMNTSQFKTALAKLAS